MPPCHGPLGTQLKAAAAAAALQSPGCCQPGTEARLQIKSLSSSSSSSSNNYLLTREVSHSSHNRLCKTTSSSSSSSRSRRLQYMGAYLGCKSHQWCTEAWSLAHMATPAPLPPPQHTHQLGPAQWGCSNLSWVHSLGCQLGWAACSTNKGASQVCPACVSCHALCFPQHALVSHSMPFVLSSMPFVSHSMPFISHSMPFVSYSMPFVSHSMPFVSHSMLFVSHSMPFVSCSTPFVPVALKTSICAICCHSVSCVFPLPAVHQLGNWLHLPFCCLCFGWSYTVTAVHIHLHQPHLGVLHDCGQLSHVFAYSLQINTLCLVPVQSWFACCFAVQSVLSLLHVQAGGAHTHHAFLSFGMHLLLVHVSFCDPDNPCQSCRQCVATSDQQWQRHCH